MNNHDLECNLHCYRNTKQKSWCVTIKRLFFACVVKQQQQKQFLLKFHNKSWTIRCRECSHWGFDFSSTASGEHSCFAPLRMAEKGFLRVFLLIFQNFKFLTRFFVLAIVFFHGAWIHEENDVILTNCRLSTNWIYLGIAICRAVFVVPRHWMDKNRGENNWKVTSKTFKFYYFSWLFDSKK